MLIICKKCQKKYNVDENRIPPAGIKVRCTQCGNILFIKKPEPVEEAVEHVEEVKEETKPEKVEKPVISEKQPAPVEEEVKEEQLKELRQRAKRLARALAKDLLLYHGEKVEKGLQEGTLANLLGGEIRRSWQYYNQQIPKEIRTEYDYFKEALNEIIGKGRKIFK